MWLKTLLWESKYGEPRHNVVFKNIHCKRKDFSDCCSGADIDALGKYGLAILAAKAFEEKRWFLTKSNILVCGHAPVSGTLQVRINIEENIAFLHSWYSKMVGEGKAINVRIEGLDLPRGETTVPREGYWAVFLSDWSNR